MSPQTVFAIIMTLFVMLSIFIAIKINAAVAVVYGVGWATAHFASVVLSSIYQVYKFIKNL